MNPVAAQSVTDTDPIFDYGPPRPTWVWWSLAFIPAVTLLIGAVWFLVVTS